MPPELPRSQNQDRKFDAAVVRDFIRKLTAEPVSKPELVVEPETSIHEKYNLWPPTQDRLRQRLANTVSLPMPNGKQYPDNGEAIPGYRGLSGRWIKPGWIACFVCHGRFLSPDKAHVRLHARCRVTG